MKNQKNRCFKEIANNINLEQQKSKTMVVLSKLNLPSVVETSGAEIKTKKHKI